jgi:hypothetical protein
LLDLAKAGWAGESSSEESEDGIPARNYNADESEGLLKQAEDLVKASRATRVRYRHPTVRLVLPKIMNGGAKEADEVLKQIRSLGVTVQTSEDIPEESQVSDVLHRLVVNPFASFSEVLNVDCTILLALVSDLSYSRVEAKDWHHKAVLRQIEMEQEEKLLPNSLWPACGARKLVCTREAAKRMHEIVNLIGTESEKSRTTLLMDVEGSAHLTREQRIDAFKEFSEYRVPAEWNLPIRVVDEDLASTRSKLPSVADDVSKVLSPINQSVFLYGWETGRTTITSNRTVSKEIELTIERNRVNEDDKGPDIWLCPTSRSLVGKEKQRRS